MPELQLASTVNAMMIGTGGHASVVFDAMQAAGNDAQLMAWLEHADYTGKRIFHNRPIWREDGNLAEKISANGITHLICGLGTVKSNPQRHANTLKLIKKYNLKLLSVIHPTAIISESATIEAGCYVGAGAIIQPHARIEELSIINTGSIVEHHTTIGANTHIAPGAVVCGGATLGQHCLIGANATVIQGVSIADATTLGAGVVAIKSVHQAGTTVVKQTS